MGMTLVGRNWVLDGGLSVPLKEAGVLAQGDALWTARALGTNPRAITQTHLSYLEAGAQIIITGSYQASCQGLCDQLGLGEEQARELVQLSVTLAKEALTQHSTNHTGEWLVAGSVGPYGACLADGSEYNGSYMGSLSAGELQEWHRWRLRALVEAGVDLVAMETIPALTEALALLQLLREFPNTRAWITFSCKDGQHTNFGDRFGAAVSQCYEKGREQLVGVGVNCTAPHLITSLLHQASLSLPPPSVLPRVVYPNAGDTWTPEKGWEPSSRQASWLQEVGEWQSLGATVVGGCCGLGPSDIKNLATVLTT